MRSADTIVIEDLNVKGMASNRRLGRSIMDASWGTFRNMLEYKCAWYRRELIVVDRWFPSSKLCSACGSVAPKPEESLSVLFVGVPCLISAKPFAE